MPVISKHGGFGLALCLTVLSAMPGRAQTVGTTVPVGSSPQAVAVNTVTNKIYVTNYASGNVTIIDGSTNSTTTVPAGLRPVAMAVNEATNTIYVANHGSELQQGGDPGSITIIDGATESTTTVIDPNAVVPNAVAVNSVTNKIYVANLLSSNITIIDGDTNATQTITDPNAANLTVYAVAVNETTNKIYFANNNLDRPGSSPGNITVLDGATNSTTTVADPNANTPNSIAVNAVTNKVYIANVGNGITPGNVTVIDGVTDSTTTITDVDLGPGIDSRGFSIAVNSVTNKIYVADEFKNDVSVIDGASNSVTTITDPKAIAPVAVAVDSVTDTIYVANGGCLLLSGCNDPGSVTVIDGATDSFTNLTDSSANAPLAVAVNSVTNTIYTANTVSGNVTVINGSTGTSGVTISVTIVGNGTVTSNPPGIECGFSPLHGNSCAASFAPGTSVTLTAFANSPSIFGGWSGACSGTGSCILTGNTDDSVTATFVSVSEDFSINPASTALTVQPGGQGTDVMTLKGVNGPFGSAIQLSCNVSGPTPQPSCALSPSTVTPGTNSVTSTLTLNAPAGAAMHMPSGTDNFRTSVWALWLSLMLCVTFVEGSRKHRRYGLMYCSLLLLCILPACGGGSGGGTRGPTNYTVTVTGTSGSIQHTTTVAVTVQ
jgi:YVTN family beta-propeller protein